VEAVVRIRDDLAVGQITLAFSAIPSDTVAMEGKLEMVLDVKDRDEANVTLATLDENDVTLTTDPNITAPIPISTGEKVWVPFIASFPPDSLVRMEASMLLPSDAGVAVLHATDFRFKDYNGTLWTGERQNVLCVNPADVDLQRTYNTSFEQTANVTTFMQRDSVTVDLGYVLNTGWTLKQNVHTPSDDEFAFEAEVQLSDHHLTPNDAEIEVYFAVRFNDIISVGERWNTSIESINACYRQPPNRSSSSERRRPPGGKTTSEETSCSSSLKLRTKRRKPTRPRKLEKTKTSVSFLPRFSYKVNFTTLIYHSNESKAEGYPTYLRLYTPNYISYTDTDNFTTNYSLANSQLEVSVKDVNENDAGLTAEGTFDLIHFEFPMGISYPDIVELNFSLTVDPTQMRRPGTGLEVAAVVAEMVCDQYQIEGYPVDEGDLTNCGTHEVVNVRTVAPGTFLY